MILQAASPAVTMLEAGTELKKLELSDIVKALDELNKASKVMKEKAAMVTSSFEAHWKQMVEEFTNALPTAEEKVQIRVAEHIKSYPMLSINRKMLDQLPNMISSIIEDELSKPTQVFEEQVRSEIARVNCDFPSVSRYLSDADYRISLQKQLGYGVGTSIFGGLIFSGNFLLGGSISSLLTGMSGHTILGWAVGKTIAGGLATIAFPLTAMTVIGMVGGALFMALPVFSWIRGKNQQKKEILDSARAAIENAFRSMRLIKIPELTRKAGEFTKELNVQLDKELASVEEQLNGLIQKKKLLDASIDDEAFKRDECRLNVLRDLLKEGDDVLSSLISFHEEIAVDEQ